MSNPPRPGTVPPRPPAGQPGRPQGTPPPRPPAPGQPPRATDPATLATRLDGQRGWLNEIDNSLRKRSIVALVLTCLAVGVAAAAMYIAITKNSDADRITALETRITALEVASGGVTPDTGTTDFGVPIPDAGTTGATGTTTPTGTTGVTPVVPSE